MKPSWRFDLRRASVTKLHNLVPVERWYCSEVMKLTVGLASQSLHWSHTFWHIHPRADKPFIGSWTPIYAPTAIWTMDLCSHCDVLYIPEQLNPSPTVPSTQIQLTFFLLSVQYACGLQPPLFTSHMLSSASTVLPQTLYTRNFCWSVCQQFVIYYRYLSRE